MALPRLAVFALEALPNARALRRFVADHANHIAFVGLSHAERPSAGGLVAQMRRHLARSGPRVLPYLAVNFGSPPPSRRMRPI
jgi:methionyl-tRNA formyltransferase